MDIKKDRWIVSEILSLKEKEILFIMLEVVGFEIVDGSRNYQDETGFPYVAYPALLGECDLEIYGCKNNYMSSLAPLTYKEIIGHLEEEIKKTSVWT